MKNQSIFFTFTLLLFSLCCGGSGSEDVIDTNNTPNSSSSSFETPTANFALSEDSMGGVNSIASLNFFSYKPELLTSGSGNQAEGYLELHLNGNVFRQYDNYLFIGNSYLNEGDNNISIIFKDTLHNTIRETDSQTYHYHAPGTSEHSHKSMSMIDVSTSSNPPLISLTYEKDTSNGYNLKSDLLNFIITPENVNKDNVDNQGHMHLYINDVKITRVYSKYHHIPENIMPVGVNTVKVEISANDHSSYAINGTPISSSVTITKE